MADIANTLTGRNRAISYLGNAGSFFLLVANAYFLWQQTHVTSYSQTSHFTRNFAIVNTLAVLWFVAAAFWNRRFERQSIPPTQAKIHRMRLILIPASTALFAFGALLLYNSMH